MTPEVIDGMSSADYHANPALGSTSLKTLATRTPAHYKYDQEHPRTSPAFDLGTVVHSLILEQDESGVAVIDADSWRTKAAKEEADVARAEGKTPLLIADWLQAKAMRDAVMGHPLARAAFTGHVAEQSIFWTHETGVPLKTRPDALHTGGPLGNLIVDLKTTADANPAEFGRTAARFGYHIQQAHYQAGLKEAYGEEFAFLFVLVEKQAPYLPAVVELHADDVARGAELAERGVRIYAGCSATGDWPGYASTEPIELPRWARYQEEDLINV